MIPLRSIIHIYHKVIQVLLPTKSRKKRLSTTHNKRKMRKAALNDCIPNNQYSSNREAKLSVEPQNTSAVNDIPSFKRETPLFAGIKQAETFNVVLAAVSTFNKHEIMHSGYAYMDEFYSYQSQAEPVIRYISQQLQFSNPTDCIDRLILLCSDKANVKQTMIYPDGRSVNISPLELLTQQIKERMNPDIPEDDYIKTIGIKIANPAPAILETIDELRLLRNRYGDALQLYVDPHGGLRGIQQAMDAMLSLVKNEITIRGSYNVEYDNSNNEAIITLKESADLFDFVSGINEFSNYGRIASLRHYYSDLGNTAISEKAESLMAPIRKIAESIQLCDIPAFEQGLDELRSYYIDLDNASLPNTDAFEQQLKTELSYLALFQKNIRADYAELLTNNRSVSSEILWCLKKGFYQQALTLIEGRMPEELYAKRIFSYSQTLRDYVNDYRRYYKPNVFVINRSIQNRITTVLNENRNTIEPRVLNFLRTPRMLENIWYGNSHTRISRNFVNRVEFLNKDYSRSRDPRWPAEFSEPLTLCNANASHLFAFFLLHLGFKYLRNYYNHASDISPSFSTDEVDHLIRQYLDWKSQLEEEIS